MLNFKLNEKGRPYNEQLRKLYYMFLSRRIGLEHISPLIQGVLSLVDCQADNLPSTSTAAKMTSELGIVSKCHMKETLTDNCNLTMHRDATTKKGRHFYGINFSTNEKTYTGGLREVCNGKAETYVNCTNEILKDISGSTSSNNIILQNTVNFMTDRSVTETKTNRLLALQKETNNEPYHEFKCAVHPLLQFSAVCEKEITEIENEFEIDLDIKDCKTSTLLRFISKLFFKDGSGDPLFAATYLKDIGIAKIPIMNSRGNRFNVLFHNAAGTFYLSKYLLDYFEKSKSSLNFTQKFIFNGLKIENVLAILRPLGIICKLITQPYLDRASDEQLAAMEMGNIYERLLYVLQCCIDNPDLALKKNIKLFYGPCQPESEICRILFTPSALDQTCGNILKRLCTSLNLKCKNLFKDHLDGGKFFNPSEELKDVTKSCPPNNIAVERLMAKLDSNLRSAPMANVSTIESTVMYRSNDTHQWLNSHDNAKQKDIISTARIESTTTNKTDKLRRTELFKNHVNIIREREKNKQQKQDKQNDKKKKLVEDMEKLGIWDTECKIYNELGKLGSKKQKLDSLKKQINIIKESIKLTSEQKHFGQFSSKGKQHNEEKLIGNLLKLLEIKYNQDPLNQLITDIKSNPNLILGKSITHKWHDDISNEDTVWNGRILTFKDRIFEVKYWANTVDETDEDDCFDLSLEDIITDLIEGHLQFEDS